MRKILWLIFAVCLFGSCKKAIEDKKENAVLDIMTNGRWYVFSFKEAGIDFTADFAPYDFQFYRDGKVSGFTSSTEDKGTWVGDPNKMTIQSNFPDATDPVRKLNATWKLTNTSVDFVIAEAVVDNVKRNLQLKKKK